MGPVEEDRDDVRTEPFSLPSNFIWDQISLDNEDQVRVMATPNPTSLLALPSFR